MFSSDDDGGSSGGLVTVVVMMVIMVETMVVLMTTMFSRRFSSCRYFADLFGGSMQVSGDQIKLSLAHCMYFFLSLSFYSMHGLFTLLFECPHDFITCHFRAYMDLTCFCGFEGPLTRMPALANSCFFRFLEALRPLCCRVVSRFSTMSLSFIDSPPQSLRQFPSITWTIPSSLCDRSSISSSLCDRSP